jgi:NAD(P)-dependent dehydrogenase (short-subunit alcohol dehydrogenase family)
MIQTMPKTQGLPEFSLAGKVVLVSGAARGLGLTQAEALLEAGARGTSLCMVDCAELGQLTYAYSVRT